MKPEVMHIEVSGNCQIGKTAVLASIRDMLTAQGYCVAMPDPAERLNPSNALDKAAPHEKPKRDRSVIVITEVTG